MKAILLMEEIGQLLQIIQAAVIICMATCKKTVESENQIMDMCHTEK